MKNDWRALKEGFEPEVRERRALTPDWIEKDRPPRITRRPPGD